MIARAFREAALLALLAAIPAAVTGVQQLKTRQEAPLAEGEVRVAEAKGWGESAVWVDARSRAKYEVRHIPRAVLLNEEEWDALVPDFLDVWSPEKKIVVYGDRVGDAAATIALRLREDLKVENVSVLQGGFEAWRRPQ